MQISLWRQIGNRPMPLLDSVVKQMMLRFEAYKKSKFGEKKRENVAMRFKQVQRFILAKKKKYIWDYRHFKFQWTSVKEKIMKFESWENFMVTDLSWLSS